MRSLELNLFFQNFWTKFSACPIPQGICAEVGAANYNYRFSWRGSVHLEIRPIGNTDSLPIHLGDYFQ